MNVYESLVILLESWWLTVLEFDKNKTDRKLQCEWNGWKLLQLMGVGFSINTPPMLYFGRICSFRPNWRPIHFLIKTKTQLRQFYCIFLSISFIIHTIVRKANTTLLEGIAKSTQMDSLNNSIITIAQGSVIIRTSEPWSLETAYFNIWYSVMWYRASRFLIHRRRALGGDQVFILTCFD